MKIEFYLTCDKKQFTLAHEIKNKFLYQAITSVTQILLPLISYPYITRILGPGNLGKINYVDFLVQMFMIFAAFGVPFYGVREIARVRDDKNRRGILIKELSLLLLLFSLIASLLFTIVIYSDNESSHFLYFLGIANILLGTFSYEWYFQGNEAFRFIAVRSLLVRIVMLAAFFVFVKNSNDYPLYYAIFTAGFLIVTVMNITRLLKENTFTKQALNYRQHIKPLWHFFLTSSAISIYIYFDTIILKQITQSNEAVGYYTLPLKIVKICQVALLSAGMVLLPRLSYLAGLDNIDGIKKYLNKLSNLIITVGLPVCAGMFLLAPEIIKVIAGDQFLPAVPVMKVLSFLPFVIALSNLFAFQILVPFKAERKFLVAVIAGSIISISLNFLLIPKLAEQGAAFTNIITEAGITLITGIYASRFVHFNFNIKMLLQSIICLLPFIPILLLIRYLFISPLVILCLSVFMCGTTYYSLQHFVFKNSFISEMRGYLTALLRTKN